MGPAVTAAPSTRLGGQGLVAAAGLIALVTILARAVGLARWAAFSHAVGATCVGQVYATVNQVPNVLFEVAAGGALAAVAVPLVARHLQRGDEDTADRTASALLGWTLLVLLPLSLLVVALAGPIAALFLGPGDLERGCDPAAARDLGRFMLLLFAPQVVLYGVGIMLTGVLQAHRRFLSAAVAPLLSSLVVIAVYLSFGVLHDPSQPLADLPRSALILLAGGTTLGVAALSLPLLLPVARLGVRWRPTLRFPEGAGRAAGALATAGVLAVAAQQVFVVVVLLLTGRTGVAGITVWNYAQTVYLLPFAVLVVPLATAAFPRLTDTADRARETLRRALTASVVAAVAGAAVLVATRGDVGQIFLALDAGADGPGRASLEALPGTLALLAPGLLGMAVLAVLTRALYAVHRPWDAAAGTVLGWAVAGLLALLLAPWAVDGGGITGVLALLAAASSAGLALTAVVLLLRTRAVWGAASLNGLGRAGAAALVGAALVVGLRSVLPEPHGWAPALGWGTLTAVLAPVLVGGATAALAPDAWALVRARISRHRGDPSLAEGGRP